MSPESSKSHVSSEKQAAPPARISLERKLELLEPRFTSPSGAATTTTTTGFEMTTAATAQSPSASHHSFSFEAPSGSRLSMLSSGSNNTASNLPSTAVRSKRKSSKLKTSLHAVSMAAEAQMKKVQQQQQSSGNSPSPFILQHHLENSMSALASPPMSHASNSNSTLVTSHVNSQSQASQPQVVAESPPTAASLPPQKQDGKPRAKRSVLGTTVRIIFVCL